jgi:hypothetical protein
MTDYSEAFGAVQRKEVSSVAVFQQRERAQETSAEILPKRNGQIKKERDDIQRREAELDVKEQAMVALASEWENRLSTVERAQLGLRNGRGQIEELRQQAEDGRVTIGRLLGESPTLNIASNPETLISFATRLLAIERLVADFPAWEKAREAEIAALKSSLSEFAKANGITTPIQ